MVVLVPTSDWCGKKNENPILRYNLPHRTPEGVCSRAALTFPAASFWLWLETGAVADRRIWQGEMPWARRQEGTLSRPPARGRPPRLATACGSPPGRGHTREGVSGPDCGRPLVPRAQGRVQRAMAEPVGCPRQDGAARRLGRQPL